MVLAAPTPPYKFATKFTAPAVQSGFTLVELLVVISIIGILSALLISNMVGARQRAADVNRKNNLIQMKKGLRLYYNDHEGYPTGAGTIAGCGQDGDIPCSTTFTAGSTVYMKDLPDDDDYDYYSSNDERFVLRTTLDNASDEDIQTSQTRCSAEASAENITLDANDYVVCQD